MGMANMPSAAIVLSADIVLAIHQSHTCLACMDVRRPEPYDEQGCSHIQHIYRHNMMWCISIHRPLFNDDSREYDVGALTISASIGAESYFYGCPLPDNCFHNVPQGNQTSFEIGGSTFVFLYAGRRRTRRLVPQTS